MQHVNVCLQALLKRLGKACREQVKEKEGGRVTVVGEWRESLEMRNRVPVLSVTVDSRGCAAQGVTHPHHHLHFLHLPSPEGQQ